jgi:CRISPR-associated protein Cas1
MSQFAHHGIACISCDDKYTPNGALIPFNSHFEKPLILRLQLDAPKPLQKRLWQAIIRAKITNSAKVLQYNGKPGSRELQTLSNSVQSGDATNVEAVAAKKYFGHLFGTGFVRDDDSLYNAALNYCYSIVRSCIARSLAVAGLEPCLGVSHHSIRNAFNLADDIIEPYRAICDMLVYQITINHPSDRLTTAHKQMLLQVLQVACKMQDETTTVSYSIKKCIDSFKTSLQEGSVQLILPELLPLQIKQYS